MQRILAFVVAAVLVAPSVTFARGRSKPSDAPKRTSFVDPSASESADPEDAAVASDAPKLTFPRHRYAYAASGVFLVGAAGLSWWANGQATRAGTISTARESQKELQQARDAAAGANLLYALAGVSLAYGIVLEFLPDDVADKADLTFHF